MIAIQGVLVQEEVLKAVFACELSACRGACCWEGDWGAPLEAGERTVLEQEYDHIRPFLSAEGRETVRRKGAATYYEEEGAYGTSLMDNGACAFMTRDRNGIARCGIEEAYRAGATGFPKPVSCHLYPVRVEKETHTEVETLVYEQWSICSAACSRGRREQISLFAFVREGLIRKYGAEWYDELEAAAHRVATKKGQRC